MAKIQDWERCCNENVEYVHNRDLASTTRNNCSLVKLQLFVSQ